MSGAPIIAGLDLAANPKRCSGYASLNLNEMSIWKIKCLYKDSEIISEVWKDKVKLIAMDAPISPQPIFRNVDRKAIKMGYRVLPPTLGAMRILVKRAWKLHNILSTKGIKVIETHPKSALKSSSMKSVEEILAKLNIKLEVDPNLLSIRDLRDAVISAVVAYCYYMKKHLMEIKNSDGTIYLISSLP
ncbi:MAG: hypothetical protein NDF53_05175 [archaeon GB-1867-097]|nr:hypothetical protein [Candidatus Culexmicrobium thermophilum]